MNPHACSFCQNGALSLPWSSVAWETQRSLGSTNQGSRNQGWLSIFESAHLPGRRVPVWLREMHHRWGRERKGGKDECGCVTLATGCARQMPDWQISTCEDIQIHLARKFFTLRLPGLPRLMTMMPSSKRMRSTCGQIPLPGK